MMTPDWLGPRRGTARLMYIAHPHLMKDFGDLYEDFAIAHGYEPINPFAFERGRDGKFKKINVEDGFVGRDAILQLGLRVQNKCGITGVFGISEGVMGEVRDRLSWEKDAMVRIFRHDDSGNSFHERWDEEYARLSALPQYGDIFADLRRCYRRLFVFVGPSAVGKTYCMEQLQAHCGANMGQVKTVTTRPPRDAQDDHYYYRVSKEQFHYGVAHHAFHDYDDYLHAAYGSSLDEVKRILRMSNGMFALTPKGAKAYYDCLEELDISIVLLQPENESVLLKNLQRRKELDKEMIRKKIAEAKNFVLPPEVKHEVVVMTGTEYDRERVFEKVLPLLK